MLSWDAISCFSALGHETRFAVMSALVRAGAEGLSLTRLARRVGTSRASLSRHVSKLVDAGLVTRSREGRMVICRVDRDALDALVAFVSRRLSAGGPSTPRLRTPDRTSKAKPRSLAARLQALGTQEERELAGGEPQPAPAKAEPPALPMPAVATPVLPRHVIRPRRRLDVAVRGRSGPQRSLAQALADASLRAGEGAD